MNKTLVQFLQSARTVPLKPVQKVKIMWVMDEIHIEDKLYKWRAMVSLQRNWFPAMKLNCYNISVSCFTLSTPSCRGIGWGYQRPRPTAWKMNFPDVIMKLSTKSYMAYLRPRETINHPPIHCPKWPRSGCSICVTPHDILYMFSNEAHSFFL